MISIDGAEIGSALGDQSVLCRKKIGGPSLNCNVIRKLQSEMGNVAENKGAFPAKP